MDLNNRVDRVDEELKLLKNEIKQVLLEIQEQVLNAQNPFSSIVVADDRRPRASLSEAIATSKSGEPDPPSVRPDAPASEPPLPGTPPSTAQPPAPMAQPAPMPQPMPMPQQAPPQSMPQPAPMANPMTASTPPGPPPVDTVALLRDIEQAMHPTVDGWVRDIAKREFEKFRADLGLRKPPPGSPSSGQPGAPVATSKRQVLKKDAASVLELGEIDGDDLDLEAEPELPPRRSGEKTVSADSKHRGEREDEPAEFDEDSEELDDEDEVEPRRSAPRPKAKRPPEKPAADIPRMPAPPAPRDSGVVDLVTLAELAEWVGHVLGNRGREYVETLLELAVKTGRLSTEVDEILRGLIRLLSDRDSSVRVSTKEMMLQLAQLDTLLGVHDSTITRLLPLLLRDDLEETPSVRL